MKIRLIVVIAYWLYAVAPSTARGNGPTVDWLAENYQRKTIYHSPQSPGYTAWVGAWSMSDDSLMVTFKQITGQVVDRGGKTRDLSGLVLANVYLRSTDGGDHWVKTAENGFSGPSERFAWGGSHCGLLDGGIIRAVDGSQMPTEDVPRRIFFERSTDLGKTWGPPIIPPDPKRPVNGFLGDFGDCVSRMRRLSDGRLLATGVIRYDASPAKRGMGEPVILFSGDEGKTWESHRPRLTSPEMRGPFAWDEWDCAELPDGRFLGVFRRADPANHRKQVRWQGVLRKRGADWVIDDYRPAPFPHSGHPELLRTREKITLHIATTGIDWTADAGVSWHPLEFRGKADRYKSLYYPRAVQARDGRVYVFSHRGWDNAYGEVDQAVVMDSFELAKR